MKSTASWGHRKIRLETREKKWYKLPASMSKEAGVNTGGGEPMLQQAQTRAERSPEKKPDIRVFHQRAKESGAYDWALNHRSSWLNERSMQLMELYFTTSASLEDLRPLAGGVSRSRVGQLINYGYMALWHYLRPEIQEEYLVSKENPITKKIERHRRTLKDFEFPNKRKKTR